MDETRDVTDYNGAGLKGVRIHDALIGITACRHTLDIQHWLFYLVDFEMELESVKKPSEIGILRTKYLELADNINKQLSITNNPRLRSVGTPSKIINDLNDYQVLLLKIFKESGLEMRLAGDASKALS